MHPLMSSLQTGLDGLGLSVSAEQQAQLLMYVDLIAKSSS